MQVDLSVARESTFASFQITSKNPSHLSHTSHAIISRYTNDTSQAGFQAYIQELNPSKISLTTKHPLFFRQPTGTVQFLSHARPPTAGESVALDVNHTASEDLRPKITML